MAKYSAPNFSVLLVDGYNVAASLNDGTASLGTESMSEETSSFGVVTETNTPINKTKSTLVAGMGIFDAATDALHGVIGNVVGLSRIVSAALFGNVVGRPFFGFEGAYSQKYEKIASKDGLTKANVTYLVSGSMNKGVIVQDHVSFTATWDTKTGGANAADTPVDYTVDPANVAVNITSNSIANPSVVTCPTPHGLVTGQLVLIAGVATSSPTINGSRAVTVITATTFSVPVNVTVAGTGGSFVKVNTTLGGVGYGHCSVFSGLTNVVLKQRHSPDDITYADLITFTTITGITSQRSTVAGTIDRYLCSTGTVSGTGNATVFSGFSRN